MLSRFKKWRVENSVRNRYLLRELISLYPFVIMLIIILFVLLGSR